MTELEETGPTIGLRGSGSLRIKLGGRQRLHVWHPDLPRRRCSEHSAIHDLRTGFDGRVLVGTLLNEVYGVYEPSDLIAPTHVAYLRGIERRHPAWFRREKLWVGHVSSQLVEAGETYHMLKHVFHRTSPGGDGRVAILTTGTDGDGAVARTLCEIGTEPDRYFDRFQMTEHEMWEVACEVLGGTIQGVL